MRTGLATIAIMLLYIGGGLMEEGHTYASLLIAGFASLLLGFLFALGSRRA